MFVLIGILIGLAAGAALASPARDWRPLGGRASCY